MEVPQGQANQMTTIRAKSKPSLLVPPPIIEKHYGTRSSMAAVPSRIGVGTTSRTLWLGTSIDANEALPQNPPWAEKR
eukprot:TCALIF_01148-PA protein Name:"Protein of unknown function" AED:0.33 eAED:0.33 QI:0/0/0/0.5/1/1/2/0/77